MTDLDLDAIDKQYTYYRHLRERLYPPWDDGHFRRAVEANAESVPALLIEIDRLTDRLKDCETHADVLSGDNLAMAGEIYTLRLERDAANAALTDVTDLLDQARSERDAARAEVAEEIARAIEKDNVWPDAVVSAAIAREHATAPADDDWDREPWEKPGTGTAAEVGL
jgi:hypothetical protein